MTIEQKLARLHNRGTAWELIAVCGDRKILVGYTDRKTRNILWRMLTRNAEAWVALTGATHFHFDKKAANGGTQGDWTIKWSGRTQRESIIEGELPFIKEIISPLPGAFPQESK